MKKKHFTLKTLVLTILAIMVFFEFTFWGLSFFGYWLNDVWEFLTLGVLGLCALFIGTLRRESAEREATEMYLGSKKAQEDEAKREAEEEEKETENK